MLQFNIVFTTNYFSSYVKKTFGIRQSYFTTKPPHVPFQYTKLKKKINKYLHPSYPIHTTSWKTSLAKIETQKVSKKRWPGLIKNSNPQRGLVYGSVKLQANRHVRTKSWFSPKLSPVSENVTLVFFIFLEVLVFVSTNSFSFLP